MQTFLIDRMPTPIGELVLIADEQGQLRAVDWSDYYDKLIKLLNTHYRRGGFQLQEQRDPGGLSSLMQRYFAGELEVINNIPVMTAGSEFQRTVWRQLRRIPCGETITYGELAKRIGRPTASRAVGMANGSNPVSIVVPCHRVIGSQSALTGYAGGVARKQWLLKHEGFLPKDLL